MTDHQTETCRTCSGNGCENGCGYCRHAYAGPDSHRICRACHGTGSREVAS